MRPHFSRCCCGGLALGFIALNPLCGDQPIMNMMPRWDGGYGFQVRTEHIHRSDLKQGSYVVARGFTEDIYQFHLEGVYTWDRSIRITAKLPYVLNARREVPSTSGQKLVQRDKGIGDLSLALPLKKYFNLESRSVSWTLAPQLRIPLGREDDGFEVWDGVWGSGLSFGYETETYIGFLLPVLASGSLSSQSQRSGLTRSTSAGMREDMQILWESDLSWDDESKFFLSAGPALYWRWNDKTHIRIEWKHDFVSRVTSSRPDHGNGDRFSAGIAPFSKLLDEAETHLHHHVQSPMEGWILLFLA